MDTEQTIPFARFKAVNERAKAATEENERLRAELAATAAQIAEADATAERATTRAARAEQYAHRIKVEAMVERVALYAGFHDTDDALQRMDLATIDSEHAAKQAVTEVAKASPHLVRQPDQGGGAVRLGQPTGPRPATPEDDARVVVAAIREAKRQAHGPLLS